MGFLSSSDGKESACFARDPILIPGSARSPGEGREWLPTPVFLSEVHGQRSLVGYMVRGVSKESGTNEQPKLSFWDSQVALVVRNLPASGGDMLLLAKSQGQRSLVGYSSEGHKELHKTEMTTHTCRMWTSWGHVLYIGDVSQFQWHPPSVLPDTPF